jgi:hypothetical protein
MKRSEVAEMSKAEHEKNVVLAKHATKAVDVS